MILQLTLIDGQRKVFVNMRNVLYFKQRYMAGLEITGTDITFRDPDSFITVAEESAAINYMCAAQS